MRKILVLTFCFLSWCSPLSTEDEKYYASRISDHFIIYYNESEFSFQEVSRFAERKEDLLTFITDELSISYDGQIVTYLKFDGTSRAFVNYGFTEESRSYVLSDNGHEIVHIVANQTMGRPYCSFLVEGLAEALQLEQSYTNVIERFIVYRDYQDSREGDSLWRSGKSSIRNKLLLDQFDYSSYDYLMAGAFVRYLIDLSGIGNVKELYVAGTNADPVMLENKFEEIFGSPVDSVANSFGKIISFSSK